MMKKIGALSLVVLGSLGLAGLASAQTVASTSEMIADEISTNAVEGIYIALPYILGVVVILIVAKLVIGLAKRYMK